MFVSVDDHGWRLPNFKMLTKYFLLALLLASASVYAGQGHLCVDLNGMTTHAHTPCNKMGMRDAESHDSSDTAYAKLQCPGLEKSITQLQVAIAKQDKLFKTPYSSVKQGALQQQLTSKQKQYQTQCGS